jgi:hypothetical protein
MFIVNEAVDCDKLRQERNVNNASLRGWSFCLVLTINIASLRDFTDCFIEYP